MKEQFNERPKNFMDVIPLDQQMSPQEAIEKLAEFHSATSEAVKDAFMHLRNFEVGTVEFRRSVNSGNDCIVMEGSDEDGNSKWTHLINDITGQPQVRTS